MDAAVFAALAEENRRRILDVLAATPRSVTEVVDALGLNQPQATKHLQALERAGLVTKQALGRRRIYAVRREGFSELEAWAGALARSTPSDDALAAYAAAVRAEEAAAAGGAPGPREVTIEVHLPSTPDRVWRCWTDEASVRTRWAPPPFRVADAQVDARPGGRLRIVMAEPDGTLHTAEGTFTAVDPPSTLTFELAPLSPEGEPLFTAHQTVSLAAVSSDLTALRTVIRVDEAAAGAEAALAGLRMGWEQTLARLAVELS